MSVRDLRDLKGVLEREKASLGVYLTLKTPTGPMKVEAAEAGFYHSELFKRDYPRLQILTIQDVFDGKRPEYPQLDPTATFATPKIKGRQSEQKGLF